MPSPEMRQFWDRRADEDAYYFVDNRLDYGSPDLERFWAQGERDLDHLLGALGAELTAGDDVVEIGCGVGRLTRVIAGRARSVRALDISDRMLEIAREHHGDLDNVQWIHGDGSSLRPVEDGSADACVSHVVFQHIPDPAITLAYVREIGRVLRPAGWAAFQVSNDPSVHAPRGGRLRSSAQALLRRGPRGQADPSWLGSAVELEALRSAARDGELDVERVEGAGTQYCLVLCRKR